MPEKDQLEVYKQAQNFARSIQTKMNQSADIKITRHKSINVHWNEWNRMLTYAAGCLLFFFIGAPLGAIIRKGGLGTPVLISIILFIIYYMLSNTGEKYAKAAFVPSWLGMWGPTILLLPLGAFLTIKSNQDSKIMVGANYISLFTKILNFIRPGKKKGSMDSIINNKV